MLERVWGKGKPPMWSEGMWTGAATMENSMEVSLKKNLKTVAIWYSNPTPRHISGQNSNLKKYTHSYVHSSTIYNSQDTETS